MGKKNTYIEYSYTLQEVDDIENEYKSKIADLEAKLAQAKMNESFEKEKKDNAFKFIEELKQQLIDECKEHQEFCKVADEKVKELEKSKLDFTICELEKVKDNIYGLKYNENACLNKKDCIEDCLEIIDQQIKELKGDSNGNKRK